MTRGKFRGKPRKKVYHKRNCTIVVIPKKRRSTWKKW